MQNSKIKKLTGKRQKILYVITKSDWGGAQRYVFDLATNLPKDRFEVAVAAGGNGFLIKRLKTVGIRIIPIRGLERDIHIFREITLFWTLFSLFLKEGPDIIHLNSSKAGGIGAIAAFIHNTLSAIRHKETARIIFTVHGWAFNERRPRWQKPLIVAASRFAALFQDKIIHVSEYDRTATLQRHIAPVTKTTVVYPAIKTEYFLSREESHKFLFPNGADEKTIRIGVIAELTKNKGITDLIDAINRVIPQATSYKLQAVVIGDGEEKQALQDKIHTLGLANTVRLAGFLPDAARYLKAFDLFVLPSLKEGFPYVLLEASAAGIPIIATRVGGVPELITNEENGLLVPPGNAATLGESIMRLANDQDLRQRFAQSGIQKIRERFSFPDMLEKTIAVYNFD